MTRPRVAGTTGRPNSSRGVVYACLDRRLRKNPKHEDTARYKTHDEGDYNPTNYLASIVVADPLTNCEDPGGEIGLT